ncbi:MAG: ABC transporter ATP-binding protein [Chloroflexi bacterium]|nr:ABC transporter ATP-binding protein [Chloroflexota bacterium]
MGTLRRVLGYAFTRRRLVLTTLAAQLIQIVLSLGQPVLFKEAIDRGLASQDFPFVVFAAIAIVILVVVRGLFTYLVTYSYQRLAALVSYDLRDRIYEKVQRSSYRFHNDAHSGDLFALSSVDLSAIEEFLNGGVSGVVNILVLSTFIFVMLLRLDSGLALIALVIVPIVALIAGLYARPSRERSRRIQNQYSQLSTALQENLTGMRVVKAFAGERREIEKFTDHVNQLFQASLRLGTLNAWVFPLMSLATAGGIAAVLWFGGQRVIEGHLTVGGLVAFTAYLTMLVAPVRSLGSVLNLVSGAVAGGERIHRLLDSKDVIETDEEAARKLDLPAVRGGVVFEGVTFRYPRANQPALRRVDFHANPGETVGIVGLTGAGKTTLALLLGRFYDPDQGTVRIDGFDVREVNLRSLRHQIGYVFQDPFLHSGTVAENIAFGRPDASREEIIAAATAACLHDFILSLPLGYETMLGERGITLSGGQRQRLALARALLIEPRVLVLDDTTSALDPITGAEVWRRITARRRGLTTIVIAQRLSAVQDADRILVLEQGAIVERGRHEALLAAGGLYSRLWAQQAAQAEDAIDHEQLRTIAGEHSQDGADGHRQATGTVSPCPDPLPGGEGAAPSPAGSGSGVGARRDVLALSAEDDTITGQAYDQNMMERLLQFVVPFRLLLVGTACAMVAYSLVSLVGPYIQKLVIDDALASGASGLGSVGALRGIVLLFLAASIGQALTGTAFNYLLNRSGYEVLRALRMRLFLHLQALSLSFFDRYKVGRLMSIMTGDIHAISNVLSNGLVVTAGDILVLVGIIVTLLSLHLKLALLSFAVVPAIAATTLYLRGIMRDCHREWRRRSSIVNGALAENIAGARVTQAYCREEVNRRNFDQLNQNLRDAIFRAARFGAAFVPTMDIIGSLATALLLSYGGFLVVTHQLPLGTLVAFLAYTGRFFEPIRDLSVRYNQLQAAMAGSERIFALLDTPPQVVDASGAAELPPLRGQIRFREVQFGYSPDRQVLYDLNLEVLPGEQVAIVGPTGAGKTSIISLACRFYDVMGGAILVDEHPVNAVTQSSLRRQIGVVLQDPFLFSGTIAENLRFARPNASQAELEAACRAVGLYDHIASLPLGYATVLTERGINLSAGQRQLLSFARALLADPRILILDEATANVDTQTEAQIQEALKLLLHGRTALIIAHRLSTIRAVDRIVVLEAGRIVEEGNHQQLLRRGGHYARLHRAATAPTSG